jgi:Tol biopolymer transport system component
MQPLSRILARTDPRRVMTMIRIWPALAVVFVAGLFAASPAFGAFPGENGRIAFDSDRRGGDEDIWTMDPDGRHLVNLTAKSRADDMAPNWRADGRRIAFQSDRVTATNPEADFEIFIMKADGSHQRQITFNALDDGDPAWSPDGRRIAFVRDFDPIRGQVDEDLFTMNADGTEERNLTSSPGIEDDEPNWSADGSRIAFVSDRDGDLEVYTLRPNGSSVRQLTFNDASEFQPDWSPDNRMITFTTDRDGDFEVYAMRADGSDQTNVTADPDVDDGVSAWSPDGEKIVYTSTNFDIHTMNADGSGKVGLTRGPAFDFESDWQPLPDGDCHDRRR